MIRFMLDTNICIYIIRKKPEVVLARLVKTPLSDVGISSITLSELEYGASKSAKPTQNKLALAQFLAPLEIVPYDDLAAQHCGEIRANLERRGKPIGALDTLIAAHALSIPSALVTNNEREFKHVPGLKIEDWAK